jgi:hypothetical protein
MIREELKQLKTDAKALRKFGLTVGGVLALLGLWCWLRHKPAWPYLLTPAAPLLVLGLAWPASLRQVYLGWMAMALVLGLVVSTVLLTLFFYLVITPVGLLARLVGRDFLSRRLDPKAASYWLVRDRSAAKAKIDYERQF